MIDIQRTDAQTLIDTLPSGSVDFVHADPPWNYDNDTIRGAAWLQYDTLTISDIRAHLEATYSLVGADAYMAVWCTFPLLMEWSSESSKITNWQYVTGGAWGKLGNIGVGVHFRGQAELLLLYKKGSPRPLTTEPNLWLDRRGTHSEKPQEALRALVNMTTPRNGLVLDLYAGESASLARACRATNRNYIGAEIDPIRHKEALRRFALDEQTSMILEEATA